MDQANKREELKYVLMTVGALSVIGAGQLMKLVSHAGKRALNVRGFQKASRYNFKISDAVPLIQYGGGSGPSYGFSCTGQESSLLESSRQYYSFCDQSHDAGLICSNG